MDQYCSLLLLWFFSPSVDSLRGRLAADRGQALNALRDISSPDSRRK